MDRRHRQRQGNPLMEWPAWAQSSNDRCDICGQSLQYHNACNNDTIQQIEQAEAWRQEPDDATARGRWEDQTYGDLGERWDQP